MSQTPHQHPPPRVFYTPQQISERHPAFSLRTLRHWIFCAKDRYAWKEGKRVSIPGNGLGKAIVRKGRRVYIDEGALLHWLQYPEVSRPAGPQENSSLQPRP
jgi:hypothetical protein